MTIKFSLAWLLGCMFFVSTATSTSYPIWSLKTHAYDAPINSSVSFSMTGYGSPSVWDPDPTAVKLIAAIGDPHFIAVSDRSFKVSPLDLSTIIISENVMVNEGNYATFDISLSARPSSPVPITITGHENSDITLDKSTLTFSTANWDIAQSIKVMAHEDDDLINDGILLNLSTSGGGFIYQGKTMQVTVVDDRIDRSQNTAQYDLTFEATWSSSTHPTDFPSNPHFSWMIGATHNSSVSFWTPGTTASNGIKSMAETGGTSTLRSEINAEKSKGNANTIILGRVFNSPGSDKVTFTIDARWSLVTVTSMLAPSPDWFVGVRGLNLMGSDGNWKTREEVELFVYDAGTDSGTNYGSANLVTNPRENISRIETAPFLVNGSVKSVGTFEFELKMTKSINLSASSLTIEEGSSDTFNASLSSAPSGMVTVSISDNHGDVTVDTDTNTDGDQTTLMFSASTWNTAQTITVRAANNDIIGDDSAKLTLSASGGGYNSVTKDLTININDNDTGELNAPTSLTVIEGGSENFNVSLSAEPQETVTVSIMGYANTNISLSESSLEFTTSNWSTAQPVTVTASEDDDISDDTVELTLSASGGGYNSVTKDLSVNINDNDTGELNAPTSLTVTEGGSENFNVSLSAEPLSTVTISITGHTNTDVTLSKSSLEFTPSNWSISQPITVNATDDNDIGDDSVELTLSASGGGYANVIHRLTVTVTDSDVGGLNAPTTVNITEGANATFTISLTARPTAPVQVSISGHVGTALTPDPVSFTVQPMNYASETTISLSAITDNNQSNETETLTLTANGGGYNNVTESVSVVVNDTDIANFIVDSSPVNVEEGSNATFTVALMVAPSSDVTVTISSFTNPDLTRSPETLLFTTQNYDDPQTVTISAVEDNNALPETETISLTGNGGGYGNVSQSVTINTLDDDLADVNLVGNPNPVLINEGGTSVLKIMLSDVPNGDVTVRWSSVMNSMLEFSTSDDITFRPSNYDDAQDITLTAKEDDNIVDEMETIMLTANGGGYDNASLTIPIRVTDNDIPNINVDPTFLSITEGESETFDVSLMAQPTGAVTITITDFSNTDLNLNDLSVTFSTTNYNSPQSLVVTSMDDTDANDDDSESITLTASGGNYDGVTQDLVVSVSDDEIAGASIVVTPSPVIITEGSKADLEVSLSTAPTSDVTLMISQFQNERLTRTPSGTITFTSSNYNQSQSITISASGDPDLENESEPLTLTTRGGGYDHTSASVTVTVMDSGVIKPAVELSVSPNPVVEGEPITLTATLSQVIADSSLTVAIAYANDSAEAPDYTAVPSITIPANQNSASTMLMTNKDNDREDETFRVGLGELPNVVMAATTDSIHVIIKDSDTASASIFFIQGISESPVDVYVNEEMLIDDFALRQTASKEISVGEKSLDVIPGDAIDLSTALLSDKIRIHADSTYQILLQKNHNDQTSILLLRQMDEPINPDSVKVRVVHNAPSLGEVDVTVRDPTMNQGFVNELGVNLNYGDASDNVLFKRNPYNLYVTQSLSGQDIEVYGVDWSISSGKKVSSNLGLFILNESFSDGKLSAQGVWQNDAVFTPVVVTSIEDHPINDQTLITIGNYPNPFTHHTNLWFRIPNGTDMHIEVVDILGRTVFSEIADHTKNGDQYSHEFDTATWASGVYFYRVTITHQTEQTVSTGRMIKIR